MNESECALRLRKRWPAGFITTYLSYAGIWNGTEVIRSKAHNLRNLITVTVYELGKPLIYTFILISFARPIKVWREVTYNDHVRNCYIGFGVEERLKSECRLVIDLIELYNLIREDADLDIVVIVIIISWNKGNQPGFKTVVIAVKETQQYREIDG